MSKLWQKHWELDEVIEKFETKDDLQFDQLLLPYDVYATMAHAMMLSKMGLLSKDELEKAKKGLKEILKKNEKGEFKLTFGDEDIHTKIETYLTKRFGDVGKKIHTGRSRNDQVVTAERLFAKDALLTIWQDSLALIESFIAFAKKYEFVPMPGYTHMQKAMPSSIGMWAGAFAQNLLNDLQILKAAYDFSDQSPLGSAAGFGVPLKLEREYTAKLLGFSRVQTITLSVQQSRGKTYGTILSALITILLDLSKFASDILLYTTSEFDYFIIADKLCTGSSIMPQKRNVDVAELLRAKVHVVLGNYVQIMGVESNLISGYNRDSQDSKKPFIEGLETSQLSIQVADIIVNNITPNAKQLKEAFTPEIFATHKALEKVLKGTPFRQAYKEVGMNVGEYESGDIVSILKKSTHIGGTGNLGLQELNGALHPEKKGFQKAERAYKNAIKNLLA